MKLLAVFTCTLGMSLGSLSAAARAADPAYYDPVCPTASAAVQNYVTLVKNDKTLVSDAVAAAMSVTTAYDKCGDRFRSAGDVEHLHYASVGAAQYRFAAGRLLRLDDHYDEARMAFQAAIDEVGDTIAWGTTTAPSQYKDSAVEIRTAAMAEISKLPAASVAPSPVPSATAT